MALRWYFPVQQDSRSRVLQRLPAMQSLILHPVSTLQFAFHDSISTVAYRARFPVVYRKLAKEGFRQAYSKTLQVHASYDGVQANEEVIAVDSSSVKVVHKYYTTGGERPVTLHYVSCGRTTDPLVIALHGFPCLWRMWLHQLAPLTAAGYHVVAMDMRGYGLSSKPRGLAAYAATEIVSDVSALIQHIGTQKDSQNNETAAVVVGHDWGAIVAWRIAMDCPQLVQKLVIINGPHPKQIDDRLSMPWLHPAQMIKSYYIACFQIPWLPELFISLNRDAIVSHVCLKEPVHPPSVEHVNSYKEALKRPADITTMLNYYRALWWGMWRSTGQVLCPVLVLWGERDSYLLPVLAQPPQHLAPNSRVLLFPKATHWLMWDEREKVSQAMVDFISSKEYL